MYVSTQEIFVGPLNKITFKTQVHSYQDVFSDQDEYVIRCYMNAQREIFQGTRANTKLQMPKMFFERQAFNLLTTK